jgi:protease-4
MGSVAASGGYWLSLAANEIWASPATITGSIGVFGLIPTYEGTLGKLGVHTDGVGTTEMAGAMRLDKSLSPGISLAVQAMVENTYKQFIDKVAAGQGVEWSGC